MIHLIYLLAIAANLLLAIFVLYKGLGSKINRSFGLIVLSTAVWIFFAYIANFHVSSHQDMFFYGVKMCYGAVTFVPSLMLYFSLVFPEDKPVGLMETLVIFLPAPISAYLLATQLPFSSVSFLPGDVISEGITAFHIFLLIYLTFFFAAAFWILISKFFKYTGTERVQITYVLGGLLVPLVVGGTFNLVIPLLGIEYRWHIFHALGPLSTIAFTFSTTYAILRFRFMGFNAILGKSIAYFILAGLVTGSYFGLIFALARYFQNTLTSYSFFIGIFFFFFFAFIFETLRDWIQETVDKILFRTKFDYEKTLRETSSAMSYLPDIDRLLKLTARILKSRMKLDGAALFLYNEKKDRYEVKGNEGTCKDLTCFTISSNFAIIEAMEDKKKFILMHDIEKQAQDSRGSDKDRLLAIVADFQRLNASLVVPSLYNEKLVAFLALSDKASKAPFTDEDLSFLTTLANQNAIFIQNAILLEREKDTAKKIAEGQAREKYTVMLEKMNKELIETREELVKAERLSTLTKLTVSLQHEINNPLTTVLAQSQGLLMKLESGSEADMTLIKEKLATISDESKRIREILRNLAHISEPIIREYMPGVEMIDINASVKEDGK